MGRRLPFFGFVLALVAVANSGCVDRRFVIESDPPGAIVYTNDRWTGPTPADLPFVYYGKYRFVFVRDGYETLTVDEQIKAPWWEYFPFEFFSENVVPWTIRDVRYIRKTLQPRSEIPPEVIHDRAEQLRAQANGGFGPGQVGVPINPAPVNPPPAPVPGATAQQLPPVSPYSPLPPVTPVPVVPQ